MYEDLEKQDLTTANSIGKKLLEQFSPHLFYKVELETFHITFEDFEQLKDNVDYMKDFEPLSEKEMETVLKVGEILRNIVKNKEGNDWQDLETDMKEGKLISSPTFILIVEEIKTSLSGRYLSKEDILATTISFCELTISSKT